MSTLYEQIQALDPALVASRDFVAIAAALSVGRVKVQSTMIGFGSVLGALGDDAGAAVLDTIDSLRPVVPKLKYVWQMLDGSKFDVGLATSRAGLDGLASQGVMTAAQATALKALAEVPDPVTPAQVELAMKNDDGSYK